MLENPYVQLGLVAVLPTIAACLFYILNKKTVFKKLPEAVKQIIYGIVFGALAVLGTEHGIPISDAQVNCRDGAVITAGIFFGAPAGIIAGVIGAAERWISVAWGIGTFTRLACTLSTLFAGIFSALLRVFIFENKRPSWGLGLATGVVVEVFHMIMVPLTNMTQLEKAFEVVSNCSVLLIASNAFSVTLAAIVLAILSRGYAKKKTKRYISQIVQTRMLVAVICVFVITTAFLYAIQHSMAKNNAETMIDNSMAEVSGDLSDKLDSKLLDLSVMVANEAYTQPLEDLIARYNVSEINLVDKNGIIVASTCPELLNYDMSSGSQSEEFMCLLEGEKNFVQKMTVTSYDNRRIRKYVGVATEEGFVQTGFNTDNVNNNIKEIIINLTNNKHVGRNGFMFITDLHDNILSAPSFRNLDFINEDFYRRIKHLSDTSELGISGTKYLVRAESIHGFTVYAFMPAEEVYATRNAVMYVNTFLEVIVFSILFVLVYIVVKNVIVKQIYKINVSLDKITSGQLSEKVDVRSNYEFEELSNDINATVDTLNRYIAEASARIDSELNFAKSIQLSALPKVTSVIKAYKEFDIAASMFTAKEVGGDFYDFYVLNGHVLNFLVADVSGKGIPSAMFMMKAKTELRSLTESNLPIDDVFTQSNKALCEGNEQDMFVTAWQCSLDLETGKAQYANAGHNPPLVKRANGKFEYLKLRSGFVLAGIDTIQYKLNEIELEPGDTVFLYTDGITEATDANDNLYGEERLLNKLNELNCETMDELIAAVKEDVDKFVGDVDQFDDMTMLALKYNGPVESMHIEFDRACIEDIPKVTEFVEGELEKMNCSLKAQTQIDIAIDEIYSNICKFAYDNGEGPVTVKIKQYEDTHTAVITFIDNGRPYNPMTEKEPDVSLSAEERKIGGLGVFMVKKIMDDMQYRYENNQNILILKKKLD